MNKADSRRLLEIFISAGYIPADDKNTADVIVYNTCSVRGHAEDKAMSHLGRLKFLKERSPGTVICAAGCMAQRMKEEIRERLPHIDLVVGPSSIFRVPEMVRENLSGVYPDTPDTVKEFSEYIDDINLEKEEYTGYVPIMKGCGNFCSYCIVPYVRGREHYRSKEEVLKECRALASRGQREIMLLGQAVNAHPQFKDILKGVSSLKGVERVRFVTSYPGKMDREIVDIVSGTPVLCDYFHIPVQSGSESVLKRMNRKYTVEDFLDIAFYIREKVPDAAITTDFIVGFPGETRDDFKRTLEMVEKVRFDQSFTFKYSPRPLTSASKMDDDVNEDEKKRRLAELNRVCSRAGLERNRRLIGRKVRVFASEARSGRTGSYKIVHWEGKGAQPGEPVTVKVNQALPHSLKGLRED